MISIEGILETAHLFAVISWMVGMLYLPRLYVYHSEVLHGSESDELLRMMERRLLKIIMNPAMIAVFVLGLSLAHLENAFVGSYWLHLKFLLVLIMAGIHGFLSKVRKDFVAGCNKIKPTHFRIINESIAFLMAIILLLACTKPF